MTQATAHLWTAWFDSFETGLGWQICARIGYAKSEEDSRAQFAGAFGDYLAENCNIGQGVIRNHVTATLWPSATLDRVEKMDGKAKVELLGRWDFNFS